MLFNKFHRRTPVGAVYIGRGSPWGNPFVIGQHGTRDEVCDRFEKHFKAMYESGQVDITALANLYGKPLECFCVPKRCHGQTIMNYAERAHIEQSSGFNDIAFE